MRLSLELEAAFARAFGNGGDKAVVAVCSAIEASRADPLGAGELGDALAESVRPLTPAHRFLAPGDKGAIRGVSDSDTALVVNQLHGQTPYRTENR